MAPKPEKRQLAKDLYLHTDKTQQEIADILDVNRRTIYLWIKNGRWEEMKTAARQAPRMILQDIYGHITAINDKIRRRDTDDRDPTMQEVEKLRKLIKITNEIDKNHTGGYMQAFEELIFYVRREDEELSSQIARQADNYVKGLLGNEDFSITEERNENIDTVIENLKNDSEKEKSVIPPARMTPQSDTGLDEPTSLSPGEGRGEAPSLSQSAMSDSQNEPTSPSPGEGRGEAPSLSQSAMSDCQNEPTSLSPGEGRGEAPSLSQSAMSDSQNEATSLSPGEGRGEASCEQSQFPNSKMKIDDIINLPPHERPSPFRDGNIIWVNHMDDLEKKLDNFGKPWGQLKMADSIRRYPDIDQKQKRA